MSLSVLVTQIDTTRCGRINELTEIVLLMTQERARTRRSQARARQPSCLRASAARAAARAQPPRRAAAGAAAAAGPRRCRYSPTRCYATSRL